MNELQQVLQSAPTRLLIRFDVTLADCKPVFRPVAWRSVTAERWQRFTQTPTVPQAEVYGIVTALGGQMERDHMGLGDEMVYWFERK